MHWATSGFSALAASVAACTGPRTRGWSGSLRPGPALLGPINGGGMGKAYKDPGPGGAGGVSPADTAAVRRRAGPDPGNVSPGPAAPSRRVPAFPRQPRGAKMAAGAGQEGGWGGGRRWGRARKMAAGGGGAGPGGGRAGSMAARRPRLRTRGPSSLGLRALRVRERHRHRHRHGRACGDHRPWRR